MAAAAPLAVAARPRLRAASALPPRAAPAGRRPGSDNSRGEFRKRRESRGGCRRNRRTRPAATAPRASPWPDRYCRAAASCLADSKSNSSTRLPLSTTTRVSSGWEASMIILLDMLNSLGARPGGPQCPRGAIEGQARRANVGGYGDGRPFRRGHGPASIAIHAGAPDTKIRPRDAKRGETAFLWRP